MLRFMGARGGLLAAAAFMTVMVASASSAGEVHFTLTNPAAQAVSTVARVSLPLPAGAFAGPPPG